MANLISEQNFNNNTAKGLKKDVSVLTYLMGGVILVLFVGFIGFVLTVQGLVISYQKDSDNSYKEYRDEVHLQNDKIDKLTEQLQNQPNSQ